MTENTVTVYFNKMERKWTVDCPVGLKFIDYPSPVEYYDTQVQALSRAKHLARHRNALVKFYPTPEEVKEFDYR